MLSQWVALHTRLPHRVEQGLLLLYRRCRFCLLLLLSVATVLLLLLRGWRRPDRLQMQAPSAARRRLRGLACAACCCCRRLLARAALRSASARLDAWPIRSLLWSCWLALAAATLTKVHGIAQQVIGLCGCWGLLVLLVSGGQGCAHRRRRLGLHSGLLGGCSGTPGRFAEAVHLHAGDAGVQSSHRGLKVAQVGGDGR